MTPNSGSAGMQTLTNAVTFQAVRPETDRIPGVFSGGALLFVLLHIPLALGMDAVPQISTIYSWMIMVVATIVALRSVRPEPLLYACAYIVSAEILWLMTESELYVRSGKYWMTGILLIGMIRFRSAKSTLLPAVYFSLLLPSILATFRHTDSLAAFKSALSFDLAGPLAFTICALFCSRLWISQSDLQKIFFFLLAPVVGICTLTIHSTLMAPHIRFIAESNIVTSAGYNPTHVSAILGLAGLICFLILLLNRESGLLPRIFLITGLVVFTVESALTFSRGGIYMEISGAAIASYYLFRGRGLRIGLLILLVVLMLLFIFLIIPRLDRFTFGFFTTRFTDTDPTHRDVLVMQDIGMFLNRPLFGVGPGKSIAYRRIHVYHAHTEYSRLLGEHGIFGLVALVLLLKMLYQRWKNLGDSSFVLAPILLWGMLCISIYAMRMAVPSFLLGLAFATGSFPQKSPEAELEPGAARRSIKTRRSRQTPGSVVFDGP